MLKKHVLKYSQFGTEINLHIIKSSEFSKSFYHFFKQSLSTPLNMRVEFIIFVIISMTGSRLIIFSDKISVCIKNSNLKLVFFSQKWALLKIS